MARSSLKQTPRQKKYVTVSPDALIRIVRKEYDCEITEVEARELADVFNTHVVAFQKEHGSPASYFYARYFYDNDIFAWQLKDYVRDEIATWYKILVLWLETQLRLCGVWIGPTAIELAGANEPGRFVTAVLHIGFVTIPETEEMLARLRGDRSRLAPGGPTRSRVFRVLETHTIAPIDAVSAKVSPGDRQEQT